MGYLRQIIRFGAAMVWIGVILGCGGRGNSGPYQFLKSKTEEGGHRNVMDLYAFAGSFDLAELKAFCRERKQRSPAKVFYHVVIFDDAGNARFPSSPFTALYGMEEDALRHIRAIYVYNKVNGYSELQYYETNAWEGKSKIEKI